MNDQKATETVAKRDAEIKKLRAALRPFARAVYNDNGDMSVTPCGRDAYIAAYFAMRTAGEA